MASTDEIPLDLRVRRTRTLLEKALIELMSEKPLNEITVQNIADRAMVNRATFYDHFEDKLALLHYVVVQRFSNELSKRLPVDATLSVAHVRALLLITCDVMALATGYCTPADMRMMPSRETRLRLLLQEILLGWLRESDHDTPELAAAATSWIIYGLAADWSEQNQREPIADYVGRVMPLVRAMLGL